MLGLISLIKAIKNKKAAKFIYYELVLIIVFAILYKLSDLVIYHFPDLAKKLNLGEIKLVDSFYSYLYFSTITQTTVGFGGTLPDGGNVVTTKSNLLRFLSMLQLLSIIFVTGWTLI